VLSFSLAVLPVCAFIAFAIAISGHKYGLRGALIAMLAIWLLASLLIQSAGELWLSWWTHFFASLMMTSVPMLLIAGPMLALRTAEWNKGRVVVGLVGSLAAALAFPMVAMMSACVILDDCL
jgi:hypothetical protein